MAKKPFIIKFLFPTFCVSWTDKQNVENGFFQLELQHSGLAGLAN